LERGGAPRLFKDTSSTLALRLNSRWGTLGLGIRGDVAAAVVDGRIVSCADGAGVLGLCNVGPRRSRLRRYNVGRLRQRIPPCRLLRKGLTGYVATGTKN
jgi:hypothetical protein